MKSSLVFVLTLALLLCGCSKKSVTTNAESTETAPYMSIIPNKTNLEDDEDPLEHLTPTEETRPIGGVYTVNVMNAEGLALEGVEVTFTTPDGAATIVTTDEYGYATLELAVDGVTATVEAAPNGYLPSEYAYGFDELSLELTITLQSA